MDHNMDNEDNGVLVGRYVHTVRKSGDWYELKWQGFVASYTGNGVYEVEWYDWLDGSFMYSSLVHRSGMKGWRFYSSEDAWHEALARARARGNANPETTGRLLVARTRD